MGQELLGSPSFSISRGELERNIGSMSTRLAIQECYRKLERQHEMLRGAQAMRQSTDNPAYQQTIDVTIREAQRNIDYLEEKLQSLELKEKRVVGSGADEVQSSRHTSENEYDALQPPPVPEHGPLDGLNKQRRVARKEAPPPPPKDDASSVRNVQSKRTGSRRQNLSKLGMLYAVWKLSLHLVMQISLDTTLR